MKEELAKIKSTYEKQFDEVLNDLKTPGKRKRQIPNLLTASRLVAPLVIIPAAFLGNAVFASFAAVAFGLTDLFDGKLARKWDCKSQFGADLDAVTDKIFVGTLLLSGAIFNPILLANIGLEAVIAGMNVKEKLDGKKPASTMTGKVKTAFIFGLGALGLLAPAISMPTAILPAFAATTALLQGATIKSYYDKYKEDEPKQEPKPIREYPSQTIENPIVQEDTKEKTKSQEFTASSFSPTKEQEQLADAIIAQMEHEGSQPEQAIQYTKK